MDFKLKFDKKGFWYTAKFLILLNIVFFSGNFATRQLYQFLTSAYQLPEQLSYGARYEQASEDVVYMELPKEKPVFMDTKDVLKKRQAMAWDKKDFLFVNLDEMSLDVYRGGGVVDTFSILAKGKKGSFFETPAGYYQIQSKSENHISKLTGRGLPWSIYLFSNYIIHGWPTHLNGRPIADRTTGSIRLASTDAKKLFAEVKKEMPVLVYNNDASDNKAELSYFRKTNLPHRVPEVKAAGVLVADIETGQILFEKNKTDAFPIASVSKLMTSVVTLENTDKDRVLTIDKSAATIGGTMAGLSFGDSFKTKDLVQAMILPSGNDAATVLQKSRPDFMALMNKKAKTLSMEHTSYKDATGLSEDNISSADDLLRLLQYMYASHFDFLEQTRAPLYTITSENRKKKYMLANINWPKGDKRFLGGKAGWTNDALQTMAGVYGVRLSEYGWRPIAITLLGSRNRVQDIISIINYLEQGFVFGTSQKEEDTPAIPIGEGANIYEALLQHPMSRD